LGSLGSDQAAGLRRLLAVPSCRIVTLLSVLDQDERAALVANLAASLARLGQNVVLVDGSYCHARIAERLGLKLAPTLLDVAAGTCALSDVIQLSTQRLGFIDMARGQRISSGMGKRVESLLDQLTSQFDVMLVTTEPSADHRLPVDALAAGNVVVHASKRRSTITSGYAAIKGLSGLTGRRVFGVLMTGTREDEAKALFENMARVASRHLAISLEFVGAVPPDDCLNRASAIGRAVVDAFPLAQSSAGLRRIAEAILRAPSRDQGDAEGVNGLEMSGPQRGKAGALCTQ
jgi:flagellar biosynthesis protein FlhG